MTLRQITDAQEDAFLEDATNGWMDAADQHKIPHHLAETMLLDETLRDFDMADPAALRAYVLATLDALDAKRAQGTDSPAYLAACHARGVHGTQLVAAMDKLVADTVIEPATVTGARLQ